MRFASFSANNQHFYGAITDAGAIALNSDIPRMANLFEVVKAGGLDKLEEAAASASVTHTEFDFEMVLPDAVRILCVGVNFPDRNAEYKDGSEQPNICLYFRALPAALQAMTGLSYARQRVLRLIMRVRLRLLSARPDDGYHKKMPMIILPH